MMNQLVLPFEITTAYGWKDLVSGSCNQEALRWIKAWPWKERIFCLFGARGSGKTHLAHLWQERSRATFLAFPPTEPPYEILKKGQLSNDPCAFVIDNADWWIPSYEEWFFHFFNGLNEKNGYLMMTGLNPPTKWKISLPDLRSRLSTIISFEIKQPDDATFLSVLRKRFHKRGLNVDDSVILYLFHRVDRSWESIHFWMKELDHYAAITNRPLTIPLVKKYIDENLSSERYD